MALIRVKRRLDENSTDLLLLACKKPRTDFPVSSVFKFTATVDEKNDDLKTFMKNSKENATEIKIGKALLTNAITDKLRKEKKISSQNNRLKVINCFRAIENEVIIVDIEKNTQEITNEAPKDSDSSLSREEKFVYDLYYNSSPDFDDMLMENVLSVETIDANLLFGDYLYKENDPNNDSNVEDEDDSNDEDNWRNDYPDEISSSDESSEMSFTEDIARLAMAVNNVNIDGEYESDLSSDDKDEALLYREDDDSEDYYGDDYYSSSEDC